MATSIAQAELSFLPDDYLAKKARRRANTLCAALIGVSLLAMGAGWLIADHSLSATKEAHSALSAQFDLEALRLQQVEQLQKQQKYLLRQADLTDALLERVPRSVILAELAGALPKGVSLNDFNLESQLRVVQMAAPKTAVEQRRAEKKTDGKPVIQPRFYNVVVRIQGIAQNDVQVANFIGELGESPLLEDVNLLFSETKTIDQQPLRRFSVEATLRRDADVSARHNVSGLGVSGSSVSSPRVSPGVVSSVTSIEK